MPESGRTYGFTGAFLWPVEEVRPEEFLGDSLEALDPIRFAYKCYIVFDNQVSAFNPFWVKTRAENCPTPTGPFSTRRVPEIWADGRLYRHIPMARPVEEVRPEGLLGGTQSRSVGPSNVTSCLITNSPPSTPSG